MTVDTLQQGRALCQALLLGGGMGVVYDLFRILRVRVKLRFLGPVLDLLDIQPTEPPKEEIVYFN